MELERTIGCHQIVSQSLVNFGNPKYHVVMASNHEHILPRTKVLKDQYRHRRVDKRQEPSVRAVVNLHPSIFLSLSEVWLWRQQAMGRVFQTYPATLSSSSWEIQGHSQVRWDIPSREVLGSTLQVSSRLDIP